MSTGRGVPLQNVDVERLVLELQMSERVGFVEITYGPDPDKDVIKKTIYDDNIKTTKLFTVDYSYDSEHNLFEKAITRETDSTVITWTFAYDDDGDFLSKTLS